MPLYDFRCQSGHKFEKFVPLKDFDMVQYCACGAAANRLISRVAIAVEAVEYQCPVTGEPILSKRAHENNLRKHNCILAEPGYEDDINSRRAAKDAEFEKTIDDFVEKEWDSYSSDKREALAKDLMAGADVVIERN